MTLDSLPSEEAFPAHHIQPVNLRTVTNDCLSHHTEVRLSSDCDAFAGRHDSLAEPRVTVIPEF